jgi:outer membrane receptor for ferrienterochelin and colicin
MRKIFSAQLFLLFIFVAPSLADTSAEKAGLDSIRVNFVANNISLREALQKLIAQTHLEIVYNDALVNGFNVNCACSDVSLRHALEELLKPTPLTFEVVKGGQIVIVKRRVNLKGYVKAAGAGETLPYANVLVKNTSQGTLSNVNGYFVLVNVPAGLCTLRVSYIGYEPMELPVTLTDGKEPVIVSMKSQILRGEAVTVTAEKNFQTMQVAEEPAQVRLSPQQISALPTVGEADIFRALQFLPGISGVNDGSSGLYVRGGTPDQNLVLLDGMTIYYVDHFFGFISAFNTEAVKDVRVFKGGFPAKFGGRTSSIVELTGKSGSFDQFQAGGSVNLLSGGAMVQAPLSGRGAWLLSMRRSYTDFIKSGLYDKIYNSITGQNKSGDGASGPNNAGRGGQQQLFQAVAATPNFYYYDLNSKLTYLLSGRDRVALSFYNGRDHLDQAQDFGNVAFRRGNSEGGSTPTRAATENLTLWGNTGASGNWSRVWSDRFYSSLLAAYSNYSSESRSGLQAAGDNQNTLFRAYNSSEDNEVRDVTLRLDNEWQLHKSHRLEFGAWLSRTNVTVRFTANDTINTLARDDEAEQAAFYLQDKWRVFRSLELTLGVRATDYAPTKTTYYEPRTSLRLNLRGGLSLKGAWGEYHQFVNRITNENVLEGNRDFWLLADERLKPSFAEHKILGATYENQDYIFDVEAYHKDLDGVAEFSQRFRRSPEDKPEALFFLGAGVAKGIEFLAQKKFGKLNGWASYTLAKVQYQISPFNNGEPYPANQDRRHEIKLAGNYRLGQWNLAATWVFASGAPYTAPESQYAIKLLDGSTRSYIHVGGKNANRLPAYHRMDVSLSRQFSGDWLDLSLGISVFNLYDHKNVWYREYLLDTNPVIVREVTTLGFVPTVTLQVNLK